MTSATEDNAESLVRRRTVVQGVAWTVPAVTVASAAPAFAASPVPPGGLNGWVLLRRQCRSGSTIFTIDGDGDYPDRGLWVYVSPAGPTPTNAEVTFYFESAGLTFSNGSGTGWSDLDRYPADDPNAPVSGFYAYRTTYNGAWTYVDDPGTDTDRWEAESDPWFRATYSGCGSITAYVRRTVTTSLGTVSFLRGPVTL